MDSESLKHLEQAKKGKLRRFVIISKGVKILSLVIFKRGSISKYKKAAKREAKGKFFHGVISGKGKKIVFELSSEDGYDKPPGKEIILKDFLAKKSGFLFQPEYQIVTALPSVDDQEEDPVDQSSAIVPPDPGTLPSPGTPSSAPLSSSVTNNFEKSWQIAKASWREANENVDAQISLLQKAMRNSEFEEISSVADKGFNGISGNFKIPITVGIANLDSETKVSSRVKKAQSLKKLIEKFRQHLREDETIQACDSESEDVFEVKTSFEKTFCQSLDGIENAISMIIK
ncbi:hypothetical protein N9061_03100 [bacterium]|nr:hypothetical protein [bacterium]